MAKPIIIKDINIGGLAKNKYQGNANSVYDMVGLDIHSDPGLIKVNQKLKKESGSTVDDLVLKILVCSNGKAYMFGSTNGKIWERTTSGVYTLKHTNTKGGILDAVEYDDYIYYFSSGYVGRSLISDDWASPDDDWATFQNKDSSFHPARVVNLKAFVGDGNIVSSIINSGIDVTGTISGTGTAITGVGTHFDTELRVGDEISYIDSNSVKQTRRITLIGGATSLNVATAFSPQPSGSSFTAEGHFFTAEAVDFVKPNRVSSLGEHNLDLLCGSYVDDYTNWCNVFSYDTYSSVSFTDSDVIQEKGINCFMELDNLVLASIGDKGNLYYYEGGKMKFFKRLPGSWDIGKKAKIYPNATCFYRGMQMFGVSNVNNNPCFCGIWSIGRHDRDYNYVFNKEYKISTGGYEELIIGAMEVVDDKILVSWKTTSPSVTYGVDVVDVSSKADDAYLEARIIQDNRGILKTSGQMGIVVYYKSFPGTCDIKLYLDKNYAGYTLLDKTIDSMRKKVFSAVRLTDVLTAQLKVVLNEDGNNSPEIEYIEINLE